MSFDLLLGGGRVVDPGAGLSGHLDVGIRRGRVRAVAPDLPVEHAAEVIDVSGRIVTPGLVDLHTHVFRGVSFWAVDADVIASRTGVTTWVDAGSAGPYTIPGFREYVAEPARVRVLAFLNIAASGLVAHNYELALPALVDPALWTLMARRHADLIVGAKARMGTPTVGDTGTDGLRKALEAARGLDLPTMVHIGTGPPTIEEVIELLGPGDILTHCFTGQDMGIVDADGQLRPEVARARERGVLLDLGHGSGSFSFRVAEALLAGGHRPEVLSTDVHQMSLYGPMFDLPTVLSKMMAIGLTLEDVVGAATAVPAGIVGLAGEIGTLAPGAVADVAVFSLREGDFSFYDIDEEIRRGDRLLVNELTVVGGRVLERRAAPEPATWMSHDFSAEPNFFVNTDLRDLIRARGHAPDQMAERAPERPRPEGS